MSSRSRRDVGAHLQGGLRDGLSLEMAADVVWIMNLPEIYLLCIRDRGWPSEGLEYRLADALRCLLLPANAQTAAGWSRGDPTPTRVDAAL